ncbi:MAG: peptide chain release factor N(5)-glutamine methyltransferase [Halobacteriovoraceae bacterium]|nr:peptide chain release factor N(5)-glutamine methyltransferase [Halobacteriovoraceae bacterium]
MYSLLKSFFESNKESLFNNYPGLNLRRLQYEFNLFNERKAGTEQEFLSSLLRGIPLEYINQTSFFYKSEFYVDERVLIPRSETELLVERAVNLIRETKKNKVSVCEVGVGSGAISLSCLMDLNSTEVELTATDISNDAITVFNMNTFLHQYAFSPKHSIVAKTTDRLKGIEDTFDFILSNPPYIKRNADKDLVHSQVKTFEPHLALFLDDENYFSWFEEFFLMIEGKLAIGGVFLMEGHETHLSDLKALLEKQAWGKTTVLKDLAGTLRFLEVIKTK